MISRWLSIGLRHTPDGWAWYDHAGWGDGVYRHFHQALFAALKG